MSSNLEKTDGPDSYENATEELNGGSVNQTQVPPPLPEQNPGTTMQQATNYQDFKKAYCAPQPQGYRRDGGNIYNPSGYVPRNSGISEYPQERYAQNAQYAQNQYYGAEQIRPQQNPYNPQPDYNEPRRSQPQYQFQSQNQPQQQQFYQQQQRQQNFQPQSQYRRANPGPSMCPPRLPLCPQRPPPCPQRPPPCPQRTPPCPQRPPPCPQRPPAPVCPQPQPNNQYNQCSQSPPPCRTQPKKCQKPRTKQCPPQQPPCQLQYISTMQTNQCDVPQEQSCPKPKCRRKASCKPRKSSCSRSRRLPNCATEQDQYYYDEPPFQQQQSGPRRMEYNSQNWDIKPPPQQRVGMGLGQGQQQQFYGMELQPQQQPYFQQQSGWSNTGQELQLRPQELFTRNMANSTGQAEQIYYSPMTLSLFVNENHNRKITQPCRKKEQCQKLCPPRTKKKGPCLSVARKTNCNPGRLCSRNYNRSCERPSPRATCRPNAYPAPLRGRRADYPYYSDTEDEETVGYDQRYFENYGQQQDLRFFQSPADYNFPAVSPYYNYNTNQENYQNQEYRGGPEITELSSEEPNNAVVTNEVNSDVTGQELKEKSPPQDDCGCYGCACDDPADRVQIIHPPPLRNSIQDKELTPENLKRSDPYTSKGQPEVGTNPELTPTGLTPTSLTPTSLTPTSVTPTTLTPTRTNQALKMYDSEVPFDEDIELLPPIVLRDSSQEFPPYIYPIPIPLDQLPEDDTPAFTFSELAQNYIPDSKNDVVPELIIEYFTINSREIHETARRSFEAKRASLPERDSPATNTHMPTGASVPQGSTLSPGRSVMGVGGSKMGPQQSVMGVGGSKMGPQQSVMGVGGSQMGPQRSVMGLGGSKMGPQQSIMGVGGSKMGPQQSIIGVGGSQMGPQQSVMGIGGAKSPKSHNAAGGHLNPEQSVIGIGGATKSHQEKRNSNPVHSNKGNGKEGTESIPIKHNHNIHPSIMPGQTGPPQSIQPGSQHPPGNEPRRRSLQPKESLHQQGPLKQQESVQHQESNQQHPVARQKRGSLHPEESLQQQGQRPRHGSLQSQQSLQKQGSIQQHGELRREESSQQQESSSRNQHNQSQNDDGKRDRRYNDHENDDRRDRRYDDPNNHDRQDRRCNDENIDDRRDRRYNDQNNDERRDRRYNDQNNDDGRDRRYNDQNDQSHPSHNEQQKNYSHIPGVDDSGSQVSLAIGSSGAYRCNTDRYMECPIPMKPPCVKRRQCGVRTCAAPTPTNQNCAGGRSKRVEESACPMRVVGLGLQTVPSITRFDQRRELNIPGMKLFDLDRKCGKIPESCRYKPAPPREPLCNRPGFQHAPKPVCYRPPPTLCEQKKASPYCHVADEDQQCNMGAEQRCSPNRVPKNTWNNAQPVQRHRQTSPTKLIARRVRDIGCSTSDICGPNDENYYQPSASTENCSPSKQRPQPSRNRNCPPKKPNPQNCITKCPSHCVKKTRKSYDKGSHQPRRRRKSSDKGRKSSDKGEPLMDEQYDDFPTEAEREGPFEEEEEGEYEEGEADETEEPEEEPEPEQEPEPDHNDLFNIPSPLPITPSNPFPPPISTEPNIQPVPFDFELKPSVMLDRASIQIPPFEVPPPPEQKPTESKTSIQPSPSKAILPTPSKTLIPTKSKPLPPTESKPVVPAPPKRPPVHRFKQLPPEVPSKCMFYQPTCGKPGYCRPQLPDCGQPWLNESSGPSCLTRFPATRPARRQQNCRPSPPPCNPPPQPMCRPPPQLCRMSPPPYGRRARSKKSKCIEQQQVMIQELEQQLGIIQDMWRKQQPLMPARNAPNSSVQNAEQQQFQQNLQQAMNQDMVRGTNSQKQMTEQTMNNNQAQMEQQQAQWAQQQQQQERQMQQQLQQEQMQQQLQQEQMQKQLQQEQIQQQQQAERQIQQCILQQQMLQQQLPMSPQTMQNNPMFQQDTRNNMRSGGPQLSLTEQERQWRMQLEQEMRQQQPVQWGSPSLESPQMGSIENLAQQCRLLQDMQSQRGLRPDEWAPPVQQYGSMGFGEQQMGMQRGQPYEPMISDSQMRLQQGQQFGPMPGGMQMQLQQGHQFGGMSVGPQIPMQQPQQYRPMTPGSQIPAQQVQRFGPMPVGSQMQLQQQSQYGPKPAGSQMRLQQQQQFGPMPIDLQIQPQQVHQSGPMGPGENQMRMQQAQQYGAQSPAEQQFRIQQNQQWSPQLQGQGQPMIQSAQPQGIGLSSPVPQQPPMSSQSGKQQQNLPQQWNPPSQPLKPGPAGQPLEPTDKASAPSANQNSSQQYNLSKIQQQASPKGKSGKSCPPQIPVALTIILQEDPNAKCKPAKTSCPAPVLKAVIPFSTNNAQCNTKCRPTTPKQLQRRSRCNNLR